MNETRRSPETPGRTAAISDRWFGPKTSEAAAEPVLDRGPRLAGTALRLAGEGLRDTGGPAGRSLGAGVVGSARRTPLLVQLFVWYVAVTILLIQGVAA